MREYRLPSGKASIETTGGLLVTKEFTVPSKASERNLALREALEQCLHLSAQCGQLQLQRDVLLAALVDLRDEVCNETSRSHLNEAREAADVIIAAVKGGTL